jgi:hypothetical protein
MSNYIDLQASGFSSQNSRCNTEGRRHWIKIDNLDAIFWRLRSLRVWQNFPSERGSKHPFDPPIPKNSTEAVLTSDIFDKFAALFNKQLLLLRTSALAESAESAITRQEMHVPGIVNFTVRSPDLFSWAGRPTIQTIARSQNDPALISCRVRIRDKQVVAFLSHLPTGCADQERCRRTCMHPSIRCLSRWISPRQAAAPRQRNDLVLVLGAYRFLNNRACRAPENDGASKMLAEEKPVAEFRAAECP